MDPHADVESDGGVVAISVSFRPDYEVVVSSEFDNLETIVNTTKELVARLVKNIKQCHIIMTCDTCRKEEIHNLESNLT